MKKGEYEELDIKTLERIQASGLFSSRLLISRHLDLYRSSKCLTQDEQFDNQLQFFIYLRVILRDKK